MAKDKVKKGFAFYLMMLILILVAAFMVWVTIMMFSPGKDILGIKYYKYEYNNDYVHTTDESQTPINFSNISEIKIDTVVANVNVIKGDVEKDTIVVKNKSMGFAKASDNTDFTKSITLEGSTLVVHVSGPLGFLNLQKDIEVQIVVPNNSSTNLTSTKINITTQSGNIAIGNELSSDETLTNENIIQISDISLNSNTGKIKFNKGCRSLFSTFNVRTVSGRVDSDTDIAIKADEAFISTETGTINLEKIKFSNTDYSDLNAEKILSLQVNNGKFIQSEKGQIYGTVSLLTKNGNFSFGTIEGHLLANNTRDKIESPTINAKSVVKDVSIPYGNNSNINIGDVGGQINIANKGGSILIGSSENGGIHQTSWISSSSGKIEASVADNGANIEHYFTSKNGEINVKYTSEIASKNELKSDNGAIFMAIKSGYKFLLEAKDNKGDYVKLNENIEFEFIDAKEYTMPFYYNNYVGVKNTILLQTNGSMRGTLLSI